MVSGLVPKKYSLSICAAIILLLFIIVPCLAEDSAAVTPDVSRLLPQNGDVANWDICPDTYIYASGDGLTNIYDGGYQLYTNNGVLDAAQQMYIRGNDSALVTVHTMTSKVSALKFYWYWQKQSSKQKTYRIANVAEGGFTYTDAGAANGYLRNDKYFVTVSAFMSGEKGRAVVTDFMRKISKKITEYVKPGEK